MRTLFYYAIAVLLIVCSVSLVLCVIWWLWEWVIHRAMAPDLRALQAQIDVLRQQIEVR